MNPVVLNGLIVILERLHHISDLLRDLELGELDNVPEAVVCLYGEDAGDDGAGDPLSSTVRHKLPEGGHGEEELGDDEVRPGLDLLLEVHEVILVAGGVRMPPGVAGHTDSEVVTKLVPDVSHKVSSVVEPPGDKLPGLLSCRQVTSERQDVPQPQPLGLVQVAGDLVPAGPHAGHVQHGLQPQVLDTGLRYLDAGCLRVAPRVAPCSPCDVHKQRVPPPHPVQSVYQVNSSRFCPVKNER